VIVRFTFNPKELFVQTLLINALLVPAVLASASPSMAKELTLAEKDAMFMKTIERIATPEAKGLQARVPFSTKAKIEYAKGICKAFDRGASLEKVATFMRAVCRKCYGDAALDFFTSVTVAGVASYCPNHLSDLGS